MSALQRRSQVKGGAAMRGISVAHHRAKLDDKAVGEIRALKLAGWTQVAIAGKYGVSQPTVGNVINCSTWRPEGYKTQYDLMLNPPETNHHNKRKVQCRMGHPFTEANTLLKAKGRECKECARLYKMGRRFNKFGSFAPLRIRRPDGSWIVAALGTKRIITPEKEQEIYARARDGQSLSQIARYVGCCVMTAQRYVAKMTDRPKCRCGLKGGHVGLCTWFTRGVAIYPFAFDESVEGFDLLKAVNNAVPKGIFEEHRQDICQNLIVRILEEKIDPANVAKFVKEETNKQFAVYWKELSLDAPALGFDGDKTFGERLGVY